MKGDGKSATVSAGKEQLVNLTGDAQNIIVPVSSEDKVILNFPLAGISAHREGATVVLECPGGQCVYLSGALDNTDARIILADGRALSADALMDLLMQTRSQEEPAADKAQDIAQADQTDTTAEDASKQDTEQDDAAQDDSPVKGPEFISTGSHNYKDGAGNLIGSVEGLGMLGRTFWSTGHERPVTDLSASGGASLPGAQPLLMDVTLSTGPQQLAPLTVLESDPDGALLNLSLSNAPSAPLPIVLAISGTAKMGVDYADPSHWLVRMADGSEVAGLITNLGGGLVSISIPAGRAMLGFRVPLIANESIDPDRTFTYTVMSSNGYIVRSGQTGTVLIVDDAHAQDHGWVPPAPGDPAYNDPHQAGPKAAYARIVFTDGTDVLSDGNGQPLRASEIMENSTGDVHYRFQLLGAASGQEDYSLREANVFTVKLTGAHGLALGTDYDFNFSAIQAIDPGYTYDPATGTLTFTLPANWNGHLDFTGHPIADALIENGTPRENIAVEIISITPVTGTEIIMHGPSVGTDIIDIPTAYVTTSADAIFESSGHPTLSNAANFTFKLTSAVPQDITVKLNWEHLDNLSDADFTFSINGGPQQPGGLLPTTITFPAGSTSLAIKITAVDDKLSESIEKLKVTIQPDNATPTPQDDNYHAANGAGGYNGSAEISIIDDTAMGPHDPYHSHDPAWNNPYLDGPSVQVVAVRGMSQTVFRDSDGRPLTEFGVLENFNTAQYKVALLNPDGTLYTAQEDIEVTIKIEGFGGIALIQGPETTDGQLPSSIDPGSDWDLFLNNMQAMGFTWNAEKETWTGTIKAGATGLGFHFLVHADTITDEDGEGFKISVLSVKGNEAKIGQDMTSLMYDSPVISISADLQYVSESDPQGPAFTLHTSAVSNNTDLWVRVALGGAGDTAEFTKDYGFSSLDPAGADIRSDPDHADYIWVRIPAGQDKATFRVPLIDDHLTEGNEGLTVSVQPQTDNAANSDKYRVAPTNNTAGTTIVDDARPWPADAGADNQQPVWHNQPDCLDGPYVKIILTDAGGMPLSDSAAASIMENGGKVYYKVMLVDRLTGNDYTALQDVTVNLKATGLGTAVLNGAGTDYNFTVAAGTGAYTPGTGVISVTIPTGQKSISFSGTAVGDNRVEGNEQVKVDITSVVNNEASIHPTQNTTTATIIDVPAVGVSVDHSSIFESAGHTTLTNEATFTFTLTSGVPQATTINLKWEHLNANLTSGDYTYTVNGVTYGPNTTLPASITIPANTLSVTIKVTAHDDQLTEGLERLKVTIEPQDPLLGDQAGDNYHVDNTHKDATLSIVDDTDSTRGGETYYDGPYVKLILTDAGGTPLSDSAAASIMENGGKVYYKVMLVDRLTGNDYTALQDVTVNLKATGLGTAVLNGAGTDYNFTVAAGTGAYTPGTGVITVTIPTGQKSVSFSGTAVGDNRVEGNEQVKVDITSVVNNEASIHPTQNTTTATIIDVPAVGVSVDHSSIFESAGHTTLPNEATFTFTLTSSVPQATTITLDWTHLDAGMTTADYKYILDGVTYGPGTALPASITFPVDATSVSLKVIANDDQLSEGLEQLKVTILPQNGASDQPGDNYHVDNTHKDATLSIIDDTDVTYGNSGTYLDGPLVKLVLTDAGGTPLGSADAASVMENGGKVYYQVQLVDRVTGQPYTALQNVTVNLKATGLDGAVLSGTGTDYGFSSTATGYTYNPATGVISITIPVGSKTAAFTGTATGDNRAEGNERVQVEITSTSGNESSIHSTVNSTTATIIDVPAVSVSVDHTQIYESDVPNTLGPGGTSLGNTATFTFELNSPSLDNITVPLNWLTGTSTGMTNQDYTYSIDGGAPKPLGTTLPSSITFPAGTTRVTITVTAADDSHSESNETLQVTLKPQNGTAYTTADRYYVSAEPGRSSTSTTIIDDDNAPGRPDLDGPVLALYVIKDGVAQDTRQASVWEEAPVKDSNAQNYPAGQITYRVQLLDHNGNNYSAARTAGEDDIFVTLNLKGISTATYGSTTGTGDYYLNASQFAPGVFQSFTPSGDGKGGALVLKIAVGSSYVDIPVNIVVDNLTETKRFDYHTDNEGNIVATPIEDEGFNISLAGAQGNESSIHNTKNTVDTNILEEFINTQVCIEKDHSGAIEEGQIAKYKVYLTQPTDEDVTVFVRVSSNNPEDLESRLFEVVIPKNQREVPLDVRIFNDTFSEGEESYELEILDVRGGEAIINENRKTVTGLIKDDMNGPVVSITGDAQVFESPSSPYPGVPGGAATYTITLSDSPKTADDTHAPSEDMLVTLRLDAISATTAGTNADVLFDAGCFNFSNPNVSLVSISGNIAVIKIKGGENGFGQGESGQSSFSFSVKIVDDALSEDPEKYKISIIKVEGSEAVIDSSKSGVETTIIDDTAPAASGDTQYLDGPFVHLTGEEVVSETQPYATYTLTLRDTDGNVLVAEQDVVITLKYTDGPGGPGADALNPSITDYNYGIAELNKDYTVLPGNTTVTIKAGQSSATFDVPIPDDGLSESNERFTVEIDKVSGNEARVPATETKVTTTIIDGTDYRYQGADAYGNSYDHSNGKSLNGPIVSILGTAAIAEDEGEARYQVKLSAAGEEDMTITLQFKGNSTASYEDVDIDILKTYPGVTNVKVAPNGIDFTFDVTIKKGDVSFDLRLPIKNDDLTEVGRVDAQGNPIEDESFTLSLVGAKGAEGQILPGTDPRASQYPTKVDTLLLDDGSGPRLSIDVDRDPVEGAANVNWGDVAYFGPNVLDSASGVDYRITLDKAATEDIIVQIRLFDSSNNTVKNRAPVAGCEDFDSNSGIYTVKIPAGASTAAFTLPTTPGHYFMEIISTKMSESSINMNDNLVETKIATSGGDGPSNATYLRLVDLDRDTSTPNIVAKVEEGGDAHYRIQISNANNDYSKAEFSATFLIKPKSGSLNFDDFDFSNPAKFTSNTAGNITTGTGLGSYANLTYRYDSSTGTLLVTVKVPSPQPGYVDFNLPVKADAIYEGQETFTIMTSGVSGGSEVYFTGTTSYDKHIVDSLAQPELTLTQNGLATDAQEGSTVTYTLSLPGGVTAETDITVELKFGPGGSNPAQENAGYVPWVLPVTIPAGQSTATFTVTLPNNEYWQGDQTFKVWVDKITKGQVDLGPGADPARPLETTIYEDNNGPKASFPITHMEYGEDVGDVTLYVTFDRPAVEHSWVTIEVKGLSGTNYDNDFTLAGLTKLPDSVLANAGVDGAFTKADLWALGGKLYYYEDNGKYYILTKMTQGEVKATIILPDFLIDNNLTGGGKGVEFELIRAQGGEVSIVPADKHADLDILDVIGGPFVNVEADKPLLHENPSETNPGDLNSNMVTYTFKLTDPNDLVSSYTAEQEVTITYHFESTSGRVLPAGVPSGSQTIKIPLSGTSKDLTITLQDDNYDRSSPQDGFRLVIDSVTGNEARLGSATSAAVKIVEDDHAPEPGADSVFFLVPPTPGGNPSFEFNVLDNDTDADGDTLKIALPGGQSSFPYTVQGVYGWYTVYENGKVVYTLDSSKEAVSKLTAGQIIPENKLEFTVTDGYNPVGSQMTLTIKAGASIDGDANAQTIIGSNGNDTISGKGGADIIHGMGGNDTIIDVDGKAKLYGDAGDDIFVVSDRDSDTYIKPKDFSEIHGGVGVDSIQLSGTGMTLDIRQNAWTGAKAIDGIEMLDIKSGNGLVLDSWGVNKLNTGRDDTTHPLRVIGDTGSKFEFPDLAEGWHCADPTAIVTDAKGLTFYLFEDSGGNQVLVQTTLTQVIHGTAGDDTITLQDRPIIYYGDGGNDTVTGGAGNDVIYGGDGNDILRGGGGTNTLYGGDGNDILYVDSVADTLYGDNGNDTFILGDGVSGATFSKDSFAKISGGSGTDTLELHGANNTLNLTGLVGDKLTSVEIIDISGSGGNSIVLDATALTANTGREAGVPLTIVGNAADYYELTGTGWTLDSGAVVPGYTVYTNGGQTLHVQADMIRVQSTNGGTLSNERTTDYLKGGAGNDTFALKDLTGDGKITGADFGRIDGGAGSNTLTFAAGSSGLAVDLTVLGTNKINNITTINLTANGANRLTLDASTLSDMNAATLTINGDAADTYELQGAGWTYVSTSGGYHQYTDAGGKTLKVQQAMVRVQEAPAAGGTLTGDVATDQLLGGAGDDTFALKDLSGDGKISAADFGLISGGAGVNTLTFAAAANGLNIDLTALNAGKINNISLIDLAGHGNNRLVLDNATIANMGLTTLTVNGDAGDSYELTGTGWLYGSTAGGYHIYTNGAQTLRVQETLTRVQEAPAGGGTLSGDLTTDQLLGGAGDDIFALKDLSGDGKISAVDFGLINGGAGVNTLTFATATDNLNVDLSGLAAGKISNISLIDLTGHGNNRLLLDNATITNMGLTALTVNGNAGDSYELSGSGWVYGNTAGGYHIYTNGAQTLRVQETLTRVQEAPAAGGTLSGDLATDQLLGGDGNDIFALKDLTADGKLTGADFGLISGGAGVNTLTFAAAAANNLEIDLTGLGTGKVNGISAIDLTGHGANRLTLDEASLADMGAGTLTVNGDISDSYELTGTGWAYAGTSGGYHTYTNSGRTLRVQESMARVQQAPAAGGMLSNILATDLLLGGLGNDIFALVDLSGDGKLSGADFGTISGGVGANAITFASGSQYDDLGIDLTNLGAGKISGISAIDLSGHGHNHLDLDGNTLQNMGVNALRVDGDADDTFNLHDNWSYVGSSGGYHTYADEHGKTLQVDETMTRVIEGGDSGETLTADHGNTKLLGGAGDDILVATAANSGQHHLDGGGGDDILRVGDTAGNDGIINSADFSGLHGGTGHNTLEVGDNLLFDLTSFAPGQVDGIQHITLGASSALKLDAVSLLDMLDDGSQSSDLSLFVDGGSNAAILDSGSASWTNNGDTIIDSITYTDYSTTHDGVTLHLLLNGMSGI